MNVNEVIESLKAMSDDANQENSVVDIIMICLLIAPLIFLISCSITPNPDKCLFKNMEVSITYLDSTINSIEFDDNPLYCNIENVLVFYRSSKLIKYRNKNLRRIFIAEKNNEGELTQPKSINDYFETKLRIGKNITIDSMTNYFIFSDKPFIKSVCNGSFNFFNPAFCKIIIFDSTRGSGSIINSDSKWWDYNYEITTDQKKYFLLSDNFPRYFFGGAMFVLNYDTTKNELTSGIITYDFDYKLHTDPFIATDGFTIFFASKSIKPTYGGYDIYVIRYEKTTNSWSKPINLGPDINSNRDDWSPTLSADGMTLYFSSNRNERMRNENWDIFKAEAPVPFVDRLTEILNKNKSK